jgi:hypothetical protein
VDGGVLIVITPNRRVRLFPSQKPWNRWHVREYDAAGLAALFDHSLFSLEMKYLSASQRIANVELLRYRRTKWMTLPITLPFLPDGLRVLGLNALHSITALRPPRPEQMPAPPFDEGEITIGDQSQNALDLVAIAVKRASRQG